MNGTHISRGWGRDGFASACGCELLDCGFVDATEAASKNCGQHSPASGRTIRGSHPARRCDEDYARTAFPEEPEYVYDHDVLGEDDFGHILAPRDGTADYWEPFERSNPHHIAAMERTRSTGRVAFLELESEPT